MGFLLNEQPWNKSIAHLAMPCACAQTNTHAAPNTNVRQGEREIERQSMGTGNGNMGMRTTKDGMALIQRHQQRPTLIKPYLIYTNYDWNWLSSYLFNIHTTSCISWIRNMDVCYVRLSAYSVCCQMTLPLCHATQLRVYRCLAEDGRGEWVDVFVPLC